MALDIAKIFPLYHPDAVGSLFEPRLHQAEEDATAYADKKGIGPSTYVAKPKVVLICFGYQIDLLCFGKADGEIQLPGAYEATRNTIDFILQNAANIDRIIVFRESHSRFQLFFPSWWRSAVSGQSPSPGTTIRAKDIDKNTWVPVRRPDWTREYMQTQGSEGVVIAPYHCIAGTLGESLDPSFSEVLYFHSVLRSEPVFVLDRGAAAVSVDYSTFSQGSAPVDVEESVIPRDKVLYGIGTASLICLAGFPLSLRLIPSVADLLNLLAGSSKKPRICLLEDCTCDAEVKGGSAYKKAATSDLKRFKKKGLEVVDSKKLEVGE